VILNSYENLYRDIVIFLSAGECYVVRPDNSPCLQKIGAKASMCLLHVSPGGVTLSLQVKKYTFIP